MISSFSQTRFANTTIVTVASTLSAPVYYFWYLDGIPAGMTATPSKAFALSPGDQQTVDCLDSNDAGFDPVANAPAGWPARRTLEFIRSIDPTIDRYLVEQQANGGAWSTLCTIHDDKSKWAYTARTGQLADLTSYAWRVTPIDAAGNAGAPTVLATELVVRTPDAPAFAVSFVPGSDQVEFSAA